MTRSNLLSDIRKNISNPLLLGNTVEFAHPALLQYNKFNTIQYNSIQFNTIQYNSIQFNTIQYNTIQYNTIPPIKVQKQKNKAFINKSTREYVLYILGKRAFDWQVVMLLYGLFGHKTKLHDLKNIPTLILDRKNLLNLSDN